MAMSPDICLGESTQLVAVPGGGNFPNYTYKWKHNDIVVSTDSLFTVSPGQTETYELEVSDGYNTEEDQVTVNVMPLPEFQINNGQAEIVACPFDTVRLAPNNTLPAWDYYWSNGVTTAEMSVGTTGIGFDMKEYSLTITTKDGCSFTEEVTVIFDFSACLGVDEKLEQQGISVYPNPTTGKIVIEFEDATGLQELNLFDRQGRALWSEKIKSAREGRWETDADLSSLAKGIYVLELRFSNELLHTKIVLE
jgi:hypothetical protein